MTSTGTKAKVSSALVDAGHLAAAAERLLAALEDLAVAQAHLAEVGGGVPLTAVWGAEENLTECRHATSLAIHEYRKRAARAQAAAEEEE